MLSLHNVGTNDKHTKYGYAMNWGYFDPGEDYLDSNKNWFK